MGPLWFWLLLCIVSALGLVLMIPALLVALASPPPAAIPMDLGSKDLDEAASEAVSPEPVSHDIALDVAQKFGLEKLALGLSTEATEGILGPPRFLSMAGTNGENWSYPLREIYKEDPTIEGSLNLTFEEGILVKKAIDSPKSPSH